MKQHKKVKKRIFASGGRNLVLLGLASIVISVATTGVSLAIYHNSGDIYLDRSRPGYLPDEKEIEEENDKQEEEYVFEKSGKITMDVIDEYLEKIQVDVRALDTYEKPFDENLLSDERLGIPSSDKGDGNSM